MNSLTASSLRNLGIRRSPATAPWRSRRAVMCLATAAVFLSSSSEALGDNQQTLAQALFDEGRALIRAGKPAEACPKFAESQRIEPASGTLLNLALCHEMEGKLATAWAEYKELADVCHKQGNAGRERIAVQRAAAIEARLPKLTVVVSPECARIAGLSVRVDGVELKHGAWGASLPVDPGERTITASAPGWKSWTAYIRVDEGAPARAVIPALEPEAWTGKWEAVALEPQSKDQNQAAASRNKPAGREPESPVQKQGSIGAGALIAGGAGLLFLGAGAYFGLDARSKWAERNDNCNADGCNARAVWASDRAHESATISTVTTVFGIAGLGLGALWAFADSSSGARPTPPASVSASPTKQGAIISLAGAF